MWQIIFDGTFGINSMQISNRANGGEPEEELNKDVRLTFSDGYTTEVNVLVVINNDSSGYCKSMPLVRRGLTSCFFLCCGVISKLTLLLVLAAPVKRKGARGEVRFPGDPATTCPVLFKGSRSLLLLACCYVPIGGRMLIFKGGT